MDLVMERAGADTAVAARKACGAALAQARDKCLSCTLDRECRNWFKTPEGLTRLLESCPNASFFRDCARKSR